MSKTETSHVVGRCIECGTRWDLRIVPEELIDHVIRGAVCQASFTLVGNEEYPVIDAGRPIIRTECGVTPVRRCSGHLKRHFTRPEDAREARRRNRIAELVGIAG